MIIYKTLVKHTSLFILGTGVFVYLIDVLGAWYVLTHFFA